ncbi:hypothetical protein [Streptomyces sp. NRRL WC-3742]|uniref:hypothetical protein n=1 Tax=Streptomyces sp. NRRL WC-3742 TaxID=1463934 RepID=UPI00068B44F8|nr:hypothetical protein [Streptomyces sp. NRRL WC-3742]
MDETENEGLGEQVPEPELCDLCGAVIADGSEVYFVVRDSSVVHRTNQEFDGRRLLVACGREHGRQLVEQYRDRPFVEPEQWAAKIGRALDQHPNGLSGAELAEATGLTPAQIEIGVRWQAMAATDWRSRVGLDGGPDGERS